jgi:hypothetical protein
MTKPLSPAAHAVLEAVASQMEGGWISPDFIPYEAKKIAAVLRAVVEQLGYTIFDYENNEHPGVVRVSRLLAIAAELEGGND